MSQTNDEIEELKDLKHAASERRARRAKPVSKEEGSSTSQAGTAEDSSADPSPPSEAEELTGKLTDQVETIFGEIAEASRERPALALVSAFAVGILVGHLFTKRQG